MKTKEEILKLSGCYLCDLISSSTWGAIETAMDEYAKQQAVEFTEHLTTMNVQRIGKDAGWEVHGLAENGMFPIMTTEELYELFIQEQSKGKQG